MTVGHSSLVPAIYFLDNFESITLQYQETDTHTAIRSDHPLKLALGMNHCIGGIILLLCTYIKQLAGAGSPHTFRDVLGFNDGLGFRFKEKEDFFVVY